MSKYCSYLAVLLFAVFILTMSAVVWGALDKTGEVDGDQNDATAAEMVRIHLNKLFHFNSEILTSEK